MSEKWLSDKDVDEIFSVVKKPRHGYWGIGIVIAYFFTKSISYYIGAAVFSGAILLVRPDVSVSYLHKVVPSLSHLFADHLAGFLFLFAAFKLFKKGYLLRNGPTAPAWCIGKTAGIVEGCVFGLITAALTLLMMVAIASLGAQVNTGLETFQTFDRVIFIIRWLSAPFFEELIFRGVLFGTVNATFGLPWALSITTVTFVFPHYFDRSFDIWNFIALMLVAIGTLVMRLRRNAVGPAIALHFVHNSIVTLIVFFTI